MSADSSPLRSVTVSEAGWIVTTPGSPVDQFVDDALVRRLRRLAASFGETGGEHIDKIERLAVVRCAMRNSVVSRGFNSSYRAEGQGTPLVLLHGWSMWADMWWDAGYADGLVGDYRVIAIDSLGHGDSDKAYDPADYCDDQVVADIVAVLDAEHVDRAVVWGFSMGARSAALLAVREPGRVASVVCGGGAPLPAPEDRREELLSLAESVRSVEGLESFLRELGTPDEMIDEWVARNDTAALSAVMAAIAGAAKVEQDAGDMQAPRLWYRGCEDAQFSQANFEIAARFGVEAHVIPGADHVASFRRAGDVLAVVRPFLERHRPVAPAG
jgi:pimeloyl-ACP methyl ester carboxylesterase